MFDNETIARIAHETNRIWCLSNDDFSQSPWIDAPDWQKDSARRGVQFVLDNPGGPASATHDAWMADKLRDGWVYGVRKDPEAKTHPCLVQFEQLPEWQQAKDHLFAGVVRALAQP